MAISKGFPPSNMLAPGIKFTELDLTYQTAEQTFHRAGLVGFCSKGPINTPTLITNAHQLYRVFGYPHPDESDPYLIYAAAQYLSQGSELFVVRVADVDLVSDEVAVAASVSVPSVGGLVLAETKDAGPYDLTGYTGQTAWYFRWSLNGAESHKVLSVPCDDTTIALPSGSITWDASSVDAQDLADALNAQLADGDGIEFGVDGDKLTIGATWAWGLTAYIEMLSTQDSLYGEFAPLGLATTTTQATAEGTNLKYGAYTSNGTFDWSSVPTASRNLIVVVDGTEQVSIDNKAQVIDLSGLSTPAAIADIVDYINDSINNLDNGALGGFYACGGSASGTVGDMDIAAAGNTYNAGNNLTLRTLHYGRGARLLVKSSSGLADVFGFTGTTAKGTTSESYTGVVGDYEGGKIYGEDNLTGEVTFTLTAESEGIEGNQTAVQITNDTNDAGFVLTVYNNGVAVETWGPLTKDTSSNYYVGTFLELVSDYIRVQDETAVTAPPQGGTTLYQLTGGSDGIPADPEKQDELIVGTAGGMSGLFALSDPEQIDIDFIAVPGHSSTSVVMALKTVCEDYRQDCMAVIDPPFGLTVSEIVAWQNGTHPLNRELLDSDCLALYWPWVKIRDVFNGIDVWVPPSGCVLAAAARSDSLAHPWEAFAGETRGIVSGVTDVYSRPTATERDAMYGNQNAVNPIVTFPDLANFVIWGDKTLQRNPTFLTRVPVRRLLFTIEKMIRRSCRRLLFEPHDEQFHRQFERIATGILQNVQRNRGIYDYVVDDNWTTLNTAAVVGRNEFRANIGIKPIPTVEFMFFQFSLHNKDSDWTTSNT